MKWSVVGLVIVGLIAAMSAAVLVAAFRAGGLKQLTQRADRVSEINVVVAAKDLPAMSIVDSGAVTTKQVPADEAPEQHYTNSVQVIGKVLTVPMKEGQAFLRGNFAAQSSGIQLASALDEGMRAVSISLTDYSALFGLLYPGSVVDVMATFKVTSTRNRTTEAVTLTLMKGVQVLGVEDQTVVSTVEEDNPKGPQGARTQSKRWMVTLMVNTAQAQALQLVQENGSLSLAMRNPLDKGAPADPGPTSLCDLLGSTGRSSQLDLEALARLIAAQPRASEDAEHEPPARSLPVTAPLMTAVSPPASPTRQALTETPTPVAKSVPQWEMEIYRGGKSSKLCFPLPEGTTAGAAPQPDPETSAKTTTRSDQP